MLYTCLSYCSKVSDNLYTMQIIISDKVSLMYHMIFLSLPQSKFDEVVFIFAGHQPAATYLSRVRGGGK